MTEPETLYRKNSFYLQADNSSLLLHSISGDKIYRKYEEFYYEDSKRQILYKGVNIPHNWILGRKKWMSKTGINTFTLTSCNSVS